MTATVIAALFAYAATNVDDLFINMLFFAQADTTAQIRQVTAGKYLGIGALFFLSLVGAWFAQALPYGALRLLGLVPIALGVKAWLGRSNAEENASDHPSNASASLMISTALITMANGADNVGVYIPLFVGYDAWQVIATAAVFALMTAVWCFVSRRLADLPILRGVLTRYKHIAVPVVLIALGVYILI